MSGPLTSLRTGSKAIKRNCSVCFSHDHGSDTGPTFCAAGGEASWQEIIKVGSNQGGVLCPMEKRKRKRRGGVGSGKDEGLELMEAVPSHLVHAPLRRLPSFLLA